MKNKPDDLIRLPRVIQRTGLSKSSLYKLIQDRKFPNRIKISGSRTSVWSNNAVTDWVEEQKMRADQC